METKKMSKLEKYQRKNKAFNYDDIRKAISECSEESAVYIGCDSQRICKSEMGFPFIRVYVTCVIIHYDSNKGASIFKSVDYQYDYDQLRITLNTEAQLAIDSAMELKDSIGGRGFEIHLDINPDKRFKSSQVIQEAMGYVYGMLGIKAKIKPEAFAASTAADHFAKKKGTRRMGK